MRPQLAPGKSLGKPPKVHYGSEFAPVAECGRSNNHLLMSTKWSVVDCADCVRVFGAKHDKPCR